MGIEYLAAWLEEMDELLKAEEFDIREYHRMRRQLNSVIENLWMKKCAPSSGTHGIASKSP